MKSFDRIFAAVAALLILIFLGANTALSAAEKSGQEKKYMVEVNRLCIELENGNTPDISGCEFVKGYEADNDSEDFFFSDYQYVIRNINGKLYRFDYVQKADDTTAIRIVLNSVIAFLSLVVLSVMFFVRNQIIKPFTKLENVTGELSKGNLTIPLEESHSRFFGRFVWGINMLRETLEKQKQRELELQKEKQTMLLSVSHDIKTPLSAIKLYAQALSKRLYKDEQKQKSIADSINDKTDEIESFVSALSKTAKEDFLQLAVNNDDFYLSQVIDNISDYYSDKLSLNRTELHIDSFDNCLICGDPDRSVEVLQNIMENAIKYGDGKYIGISFSDEEDCRLVTVANSGCTLKGSELVHIFDSFHRGSNSHNKSGSGLGLYICRILMMKMNGDIYAEIKDGEMRVTAVFKKT